MNFVIGGITAAASEGVLLMASIASFVPAQFPGTPGVLIGVNGVTSGVSTAQEMVAMDIVWWSIAAGVTLPLVLAFLAGNCVETYRSRRILSRLAKERRDLANERRDLEAGWDELDAGWDQLEAEQEGTHRSRQATQV